MLNLACFPCPIIRSLIDWRCVLSKNESVNGIVKTDHVGLVASTSALFVLAWESRVYRKLKFERDSWDFLVEINFSKI